MKSRTWPSLCVLHMWNPPSYLFNPHARGAGRPLILKDKVMIYMLSAPFCSLDQLGLRNIADDSLSIYLSELLLRFPRSVFNLISQQSQWSFTIALQLICAKNDPALHLPEMFVFLASSRKSQEADDARGKGHVTFSRKRPAIRTFESGPFFSCPQNKKK